MGNNAVAAFLGMFIVAIIAAFYQAGHHMAGSDAFKYGQITYGEVQMACKVIGKGK